MQQCKRISVAEARQMIDQGEVQIVDIRDPASYSDGHIDGARLLDNNSLPHFLAAADKAQPVLVVCYHGNSSQPAAVFLEEQGFAEVYSLDGGYELWRQR